MTNAEIRAALTASALDLKPAGVDTRSGYGVIRADLLLRTTGAKPQPLVQTGTPTVTPVTGDGTSAKRSSTTTPPRRSTGWRPAASPFTGSWRPLTPLADQRASSADGGGDGGAGLPGGSGSAAGDRAGPAAPPSSRSARYCGCWPTTRRAANDIPAWCRMRGQQFVGANGEAYDVRRVS